MATFVIGDYKYTTLTTSTNVNVKPNDTTKSSYQDIPASVIYGGVEYSVINMVSCFEGCTSLTQAPAIPNSVIDMAYCFRGCTSLTQAPAIPNSVTNMPYCFRDCTSLTQASSIPNSVTNMAYCFYNCTSLIQASSIPNSVTNMNYCFYNCTSLIQAPVIPSSVTTMTQCFRGCTSLTQVPVIPSSVASMDYCFYGCISLVGDIYIYYLNTQQSQMTNCFYNTTQSITLYAMNDNIEVCDLLAATANNDNVLVNIHSETPISFTDTQMNYMTNEGLKPLSLQTDASLVQCEIPDLVNGGTIVTNVNDALIDLTNRNKTPFVTYYFNDEDVINGIRFTWDYDNIIDSTLQLRGTSTGLDMVICKYTASFNGNYFIRAPRMGNGSGATYYRINNGVWHGFDVVTSVFSLASDDTVDVRLVVPSGNYITKQGQLAIFVSGGGV